MIINLNLLPKKIDENIIIPDSFYKSTGIKKLDKIHVKGIIDYNLSDEIEINLQVTGEMTLVDSITLDEIKENINITINSNLEEIASESTYFYKKDKNTLDLVEFLWENIVLEVPIRRTYASGTFIEGDGWSLNKTDGE